MVSTVIGQGLNMTLFDFHHYGFERKAYNYMVALSTKCDYEWKDYAIPFT